MEVGRTGTLCLPTGTVKVHFKRTGGQRIRHRRGQNGHSDSTAKVGDSFQLFVIRPIGLPQNFKQKKFALLYGNFFFFSNKKHKNATTTRALTKYSAVCPWNNFRSIPT